MMTANIETYLVSQINDMSNVISSGNDKQW